MRSVLAAMLTVVLAAVPVHAQPVTDSIGPRAGSWGAEVVMGGGTGASLLRVSSSASAWRPDDQLHLGPLRGDGNVLHAVIGF